MIIGISGKMGTGKTTLARHLVKTLGGEVMSFADALRQEVKEHFGIPMGTMTDQEAKATLRIQVGFKDMLLRELLQWWGAERRRSDPDYWVKQLLHKAGEGIVLVDDVRYRNEARAIQAAGGHVVRIDPYPGWQSSVGADHLSETDLDDYDYFDMRLKPKYGDLYKTAFTIKKELTT